MRSWLFEVWNEPDLPVVFFSEDREAYFKLYETAARTVMASKAAVWQIPVNVYCTMKVTMAELAARVRPCGRVGRYLYDQMEEYNLHSTEPCELRKGENWCLGDSPVVGVLLQCGWRGNFHTETAPLIADDMRYLPNPGGKEIRVYDFVDVRMILEDMYAKLALCER